MLRMEPWILCLVMVLALAGSLSYAAAPAGLLAEWNFDEGRGAAARDSATGKHPAAIEGATFETVGKDGGHALYLDGMDDCADAGDSAALGIAEGGPITIEAWVRPMRKANGEMVLFGEGYDSFVMTYYNTEMCLFYIGSGGNNVFGKVNLNEWNHVVASFDGTMLTMWINGRQTGHRESKLKTYKPAGRFMIGTRGQPSAPKFKGMVDRVRIYNRALTDPEAVGHFKTEAPNYGFDPAWFSRLKATPYYYFDRNEIVVEADYRGLQPLTGAGTLQVDLVSDASPGAVLQTKTVESVTARGSLEVKFADVRLDPGSYRIRASFRDEAGARPVEEFPFTYPLPVAGVPSPSDQIAAELPQKDEPKPFDFSLLPGGGFQVSVNGTRFPFETRISWPNGSFNRLAAGSQPSRDGEPTWRVETAPAGKKQFAVRAVGSHYTLDRRIEVFPTHVYVTDTYKNITQDDLGLLIYNETPVKDGQVKGSWLSGHERLGRQIESNVPDYGPSVFFTQSHAGIGIVPIDDVYVVQAVSYVGWEGAAGVGTERLAIAPGKSVALEWAVYPTASGDYYDFVNAFRHVEGRIGTVSQAPGFITQSLQPPARRRVPDKQFIDLRGIQIGIIHCLSFPEDDPELMIEGIEFTDFPKEMALLKQQADAIHALHPGFKAVFHIAHSLYCTNNPDRFADSKVIGADGKQVSWGDGSDFGKEKQAAGWKWWIFYPTPGNSFHDAMMKSVDVMMDDLGFNGAFMDGFMAGYISPWTYDGVWDGHSAEIDHNSKTIKRKIGSVVLLSQPSMIEYARKIRDKGGVVIANNTVYTRTISQEKHIIFDNECASGPQMHFAPTVTALGNPLDLTTEKAIYLDMLDKLSWGETFVYYGEGCDVTYPSLASKQYPITYEEIRSGLVKGKERIITMNPGVHGWPGDRRLHRVYLFDGRGAMVPHDFNTAVDAGSVRTELKFGPYQSAVIEPIAATLECESSVNARVLQYDAEGLRVMLNGQGPSTLTVDLGSAGGLKGNAFSVTINGTTTRIVPTDGILAIPLALNGPAEVVVTPLE